MKILPEVYFTILENQDEVVALILEKGLNPDTKLSRDNPKKPGTLLAWAASQGHESLTQHY